MGGILCPRSTGTARRKNMKVLVTGGSGKLGQFVLRDLCEHGHEALNVDRTYPAENRYGWTFKTDLADASQLFDAFMKIRPEAVIHLAANPAPHGFPRHNQFNENVAITHAVLQASGDLGVKRVVFASSEMANGWSSRFQCPPRLPFDETVTITTPNAYALSKVVGEVMAESMQIAYPEVAIASLRVNLVTHPDWPYAYRNLDNFPGHHSNLWAYQDARDAASACRLWIESDLPGHRVYMVAADDSLINLPIREAVARHFGEHPEIPDLVSEFGSLVDCSRIKADLGWVARHSWRDAKPE
jgi:nucleoside-diphosphate-sugar epimerase